MKHRINTIAPLLFASGIAMATSGCAAIEGLFKAGVWVGVLAVCLVVGLGGAALGIVGNK